MKTKLSTLFLSLFLVNIVHAQGVFEDAKTIMSVSKFEPEMDGDKVKIIADFTDSASANALVQIFKNYYPDAKFSEEMSPSEIKAEIDEIISDNKFLKISGGVEADTDTGKTKLNLTYSKALNSISGLNVTNIADGLAKFLVQRTKQELNIYFFSKFKERLEEEEELAILFPETHEILLAIGDQIYNYNVYINTMRSAFEEDLKNILLNTERLIASEKLNLFDKQPIVKAMVEEGLLVFDLLRNGEHPGDILNTMATNTKHLGKFDAMHANVKPSVKLVNYISQSLRSSDGDRYWVEASDVKSAFQNGGKEFAYLYLGLLWQQIKLHDPYLQFALKGSGDTLVTEWLEDTKTSYENITAYVGSVATQTKQVEAAIANLKSKSNGEIHGYASYVGLYESVNNLFQKVADLDQIPSLDTFDLPRHHFKRFLNISDLVESIAAALQNEQYTTAVFKTSQLLDTLSVGRYDQSSDFIKYAGFMASMVEAESSDEVAAIIESFAMPPGSYRVKRYSNNSIAVQGYVGFIGGGENLWDSKLAGKWGKTYSLFSPVGLQFSRGSWVARKNHCKERKGSSNGLFLSVIDLGAITAFRFQNDDSTYAEKIPEVTLGQIMAPGLFYTHGIARAPISWGVGGQFMPQLRKVNDLTTNTVSTEDAFRAVIFIAVDIPLLSLRVKEARSRKAWFSDCEGQVKCNSEWRCN